MKLLNYIHTILLVVGFGLLSYGLFRISPEIGLTVTGVLLIIFAFYLDRTS
ncbi:hypothetical protein SAG0136_08070 [Streptococcus agalactiae LMG 14747]|uniref:Uncharacterized protein n=1 Tax=Streptococcus agalactiae LMG 14747 TaxID=1154860 RepID=V6Z4F7_STRAG|nr:hypothetical protein SAG0136_08070 [Streptococcus agalactiae LMG 14747]